MAESRPAGWTFELWDLASRNLVGEYADERTALAFVRALAAEHGPEAASVFALVREDERGDSTTIAKGPDLLDRAHRAPRPSAAARS